MIDERQYFEQITATTVRYLNELRLETAAAEDTGEEKTSLYDVTFLIRISGKLEGELIVSAELALARALAKRFMIEDISDEEAAQYAIEVVAEVSNVISGNALCGRDEVDIYMGRPMMIVSTGAAGSLKYRRALRQAYRTDEGMIQCMYIPEEEHGEFASRFSIQFQTQAEEERNG